MSIGAKLGWKKPTTFFQSFSVFGIADKGLRDGEPAGHLHKACWDLPALLYVPYHFLSQWLHSNESETSSIQDAPSFYIPLGIEMLSITLWYTMIVWCILISELLKCEGNHEPWSPWSTVFVYVHYFWLTQHRAWSPGRGPPPSLTLTSGETLGSLPNFSASSVIK